MTTPPAEPAAAAGPLPLSTVVTLSVLVALFIAGFVILAALGKDVATYALFVGGPAMSGVVLAVVNRRVTNVGAQVAAAGAETTAVVAERVSGLDSHLSAQDVTLGQIVAGVNGEPAAPARTAQGVPVPRESSTEQPSRWTVR